MLSNLSNKCNKVASSNIYKKMEFMEASAYSHFDNICMSVMKYTIQRLKIVSTKIIDHHVKQSSISVLTNKVIIGTHLQLRN